MQMVNFIMQEAKEKANEIFIKTEHDFSLEKQMKVHNAKLKIQQEFKQREKDYEMQKRIAQSVAVSRVRVSKMEARQVLIKGIEATAIQKLTKSCTDDQKEYATLLVNLLVQGFIHLNEKVVEVRCREIDARLVQKVLPEAVDLYKKQIREACNGEEVDLTVTVANEAPKFLPPPPMGDGTPSCAGGVIVTAQHGRISCDNTLDSRLEQAFMALMPVIKFTVFTHAV